MIMTNLRTGIVLVLAFVGGLTAQTEIWTKITATPGAVSLVITCAEFSLPARASTDLVESARTIRQVMLKDLRNSLFFRIVEPESGKRYSAEPSSVDFANWAKTGASVLVAGNISDARLTLRLYDLLSKRLIASKDYSREISDRALGHRVADEIIRLLTGEEGVSTSSIVFSRKSGNSRELYAVDQDGLNLRQLTTDGSVKLSPDWSPDGKRIAYSAYWGSQLVIFSYDVARGTTAILCNHADMNDTPSWSPDGSMLAAALSTGSGMEIYVMDANGRNPRRITYNGGVNTSPVWSPNGRQLAFVSDRTGSPQIYVINADGTAQRRLTYEGSYNTTPAWSPRGDLIAFSRREGYGNQICITDLSGSETRQLTWSGDNVEPCFSPDGLRIAFISNRDGPREVYVMNWDGTDQRRLTTIGGCSTPSWSPPLRD